MGNWWRRLIRWLLAGEWAATMLVETAAPGEPSAPARQMDPSLRARTSYGIRRRVNRRLASDPTALRASIQHFVVDRASGSGTWWVVEEIDNPRRTP